MMERSDKYRWCVCKRCGVIPIYSTKINSSICNNCNNNDLAIIETPYTFKLLMQELESMGLQMRINTDSIELPIEQLVIDDIDIDDIIKEAKIIKEEIKENNKICPDDKVINPNTGRCISKKSALAKKLKLVGGVYFYNNYKGGNDGNIDSDGIDNDVDNDVGDNEVDNDDVGDNDVGDNDVDNDVGDSDVGDSDVDSGGDNDGDNDVDSGGDNDVDSCGDNDGDNDGNSGGYNDGDSGVDNDEIKGGDINNSSTTFKQEIKTIII